VHSRLHRRACAWYCVHRYQGCEKQGCRCGIAPALRRGPAIASTERVFAGSNFMGLLTLIIGLVVLLGAHVFVTLREQRAALMARLGNAYRAIFALVSLAGLGLIIWGFREYRAHELVQIWSPPAIMRDIMMPLVLLAVIILVSAFIPSHIRKWLKHPMLTSVKTWALAHLLANGDLGGIILFASFLLWGG